MTLLLRKVEGHSHATDNYRVVYEGEEIGSIGIKNGKEASQFWAWGIDVVLPQQDFPTDGMGRDREDCMTQFKAAWHKFSRNPERLEEFMTIKRASKRPWVK